jgi:3(or 17)beta-hydroxysteroid dehydrogenase
MNRVANKVAPVTGAASGGCRADALLLAAEGARIALTGIDDDAGRALAREIGDAAPFVRHDIAGEDGWRHAIASTRDQPVSSL